MNEGGGGDFYNYINYSGNVFCSAVYGTIVNQACKSRDHLKSGRQCLVAILIAWFWGI